MSALIKASELGAALSISPIGQSISTLPAAETHLLEVVANPDLLEIERLKALLAERDETIAKHAAALEEARSEGERDGRFAAEGEFEADRTAAIERLDIGIEAAREGLTKTFEQAQVLALLVARETLEKLFCDPGARFEIVTALLTKQLDQISRQLLVVIEVSRLDFPDARELEVLREKLGLSESQLVARNDLDEGSCRMNHRLGTIDLGIDCQWGAIRAMLDEHFDFLEEGKA